MWAIHDWPERYGDHPRFTLKDGDWVSLEFAVTAAVPEWGGQAVSIMREEDTLITAGAEPEYLSGPQVEPVGDRVTIRGRAALGRRDGRTTADIGV